MVLGSADSLAAALAVGSGSNAGTGGAPGAAAFWPGLGFGPSLERCDSQPFCPRQEDSLHLSGNLAEG